MAEIPRDNPYSYVDDDGYETTIEEWTEEDEKNWQEANEEKNNG